MRQVPQYVIIGDGCMATHMACYFRGLGLSYQQWSRRQNAPADLQRLLVVSTHVLLLIRDDAIEDFVRQYDKPEHQHLLWIHYSGSLVSQAAVGAHPLCTFPPTQLYSVDEYKKIPFMVGGTGRAWEELFPGLPNPHYSIADQDRAYYHALCVLANNFSTLLWQKFFSAMAEKFSVSKTDLIPFLHHTYENIATAPDRALTGPLKRKDSSTIVRDLRALKDDPFYLIFESFIQIFAPEILDNEAI